MTLPRSAAEVLSGHVVFELECIDRMYCNLYVPKLQRELGVVGFIREHLGKPVASTAVLADRTEAFYAGIRAFAARNAIPVVEFASGQRKDDVMREHLAQFLAAGRTEGVVFIGRARRMETVPASHQQGEAVSRPGDRAEGPEEAAADPDRRRGAGDPGCLHEAAGPLLLCPALRERLSRGGSAGPAS